MEYPRSHRVARTCDASHSAAPCKRTHSASDRPAVSLGFCRRDRRCHRKRSDGGQRRSEREHARGEGVHGECARRPPRRQRPNGAAKTSAMADVRAVARHAEVRPAGGAGHMNDMVQIVTDLRDTWIRPEPPEAEEETGFFTDTTICIGCKACEVACKQWNQLPADGFNWTGNSYDNTVALSDTTWRHVAFVEQFDPESHIGRWLMMSEVCKHCQHAPWVEVCPTGALIYNEFGNVYVQQDVCNGCANCVVGCPFGVINRNKEDGRAHKCTLCYDRQKDGLVPACAKSCPTESIKFGKVSELREHAKKRVEELHARGETDAYLYGAEASGEYSALNSFFLLKDNAAIYNLHERPRRGGTHLKRNYLFSFAASLALTAVSAVLFKGESRG